ncbi:LamG-like jellyroll fold domain-containing protein [Acrocarpospora sp. B8E8]|uniref:LamG-like jellyroll fold domain-containing protein n=1 Tax=Acrocarpospora sp. B8E8 TaxID=3153572 RepID=UPI00325E2B3A
MPDWRSDFAEFARGNLPVQSAEHDRAVTARRPAVCRRERGSRGRAARRRGAVAGEHASGVAISTVVQAMFSEAVQEAHISVRDPANAAVAGNAVMDVANTVLTFTPAQSLTAGATYTVTISGAKDGAGNVMTPDSWSFTTNNLGLVAAYGMEEGAGSTVGDASGQHNTGVALDTSWVTGGRYGKALSFNGTSNGTVPSAWFATDTTEMVTLDGTAPLPTGEWRHVAVTYNGSTALLFIDGTQVSQTAAGGGLVDGGDLHIGANSIWGEYFSGLIDEVRVYNIAQTPAQIGPGHDTTYGRWVIKSVAAQALDPNADLPTMALEVVNTAGGTYLSEENARFSPCVTRSPSSNGNSASAPGRGSRPPERPLSSC